MIKKQSNNELAELFKVEELEERHEFKWWNPKFSPGLDPDRHGNTEDLLGNPVQGEGPHDPPRD